MLQEGFMLEKDKTDYCSEEPNHFTHITFSKVFIDKLLKENKQYVTVRLIPHNIPSKFTNTNY
jgi:hypothetical protein